MLSHDLDEVDGPAHVDVVVQKGLRHALADILAPREMDYRAVLGALKCFLQIFYLAYISL